MNKQQLEDTLYKLGASLFNTQKSEFDAHFYPVLKLDHNALCEATMQLYTMRQALREYERQQKI